MKERVVRIRIPEVLYKKYKLLCVEKDLSIPKQTAQLLRNFLEIQENNENLMKHIKNR